MLLWKTPPGLELILAQEGVPFETVKDPHPLSFRAGRFVLFDGQTAPAGSIGPLLGRAHVLIDVDDFRRGETPDPFAALVDQQRGAWLVDFWRVHGFRAGCPVCQGLAAAPFDRPAARCGDRGGRRLDADFPVSLSVSIGVQLPGRPR